MLVCGKIAIGFWVLVFGNLLDRPYLGDQAGYLILCVFFPSISIFFPRLKQPVTLVFDIGKTTKKALLFDQAFNVLDEITETFPETYDNEGFPCENLPVVVAWTRNILKRFLNNPAILITHINFSAYGASLVSIDHDNEAILPFYNYLKPCPEQVARTFKRSYVQNTELLEETASPWLGFLNSGIQAYWMKVSNAEEFSRTKALLHLPQFFAFVVTGKLYNEKTSLGCHTMLWDFRKQQYHQWVELENLTTKFPEIVSTSQNTDHRIDGHFVKVGVGVHDSSAALMPYLTTRDKPFLMLSTGTWNICFNPWNLERLTKEELEKDCLCFMTFEGKPVKASRIFLGHEHEVQQKKLAAHFQVSPDEYRSTRFDERIYHRLKADPEKRFYPLEMTGSGPFPEPSKYETDYHAFPDFLHAQHRLMIELASWQKLSIDLVDPYETMRDVILVGGFSKSTLFLEILKREIPGRRFYLSDHPRASALGAAWLVHDAKTIESSKELLNILPY
jgi:L-fuculokinase